MKIFVTGGGGFIGRHLVKTLLSSHQVTIYENFSNSDRNNLDFVSNNSFNIIEGDLSNYELLKKSLRDFDLVIHLAAKIDISESLKHPEISNLVNVQGTINILKACVESNVKNIIGASSAAVYGNPNCLPVTEETLPNPVSPYGADKLSMEFYLRAFANAYDMNSVSLRFFNVFGEGQSNEYAGVITKFIEMISTNKPLEIFGDGMQTRDFVSINDVVESIYDAIKNGKNGTYNIASGKAITINELAEFMISLSKKDLEIHHISEKHGNIRYSEADISLAKSEIKYVPKLGLNEIKTLLK